ncbi:MMPL family transporter [Nocardioides sp. cx-173]|uniref:MMPL family transporter n=1 Tax=Nocardioides sp. cx-173 TaxID=2898796 RepID=UPI001E56796D|nr:MMPL family transporter [Nocardioides sp. cx-173]MCD4523280.1 MMPL family transporter [Nocardioides sp. cx-173]UGB42379.1 MMPL family transporter [Nocardioides sp. cx-173]
MSKTLLHRLITRPRHALAGLFFFVLVAGAFGGPVAGALYSSGGFVPDDSDSVRAVERVEAATAVGATPGLAVLVDDADPARVGDVTARLSGVDGVARVTPGGASEDGTNTLVLGTLEAEAVDEDVAAEAIEEFADDGDVTVGGEAVAGLQIGETVGKDLGRAELLAMPLLLLLSLIFFGGRAALLPLVVGLTTVLGTFLVLAGVNQVYGLSVFALNLVIGLGLGLAIDYTLFLLTRYREELQRQGATHGAIRTTMQTAGRTVVFSAATVAVALATLTVFPMGFTKSMGIAGAVVAVVAATASLVVAPVFFALLGARLARRSAARSGAASRWYRFSHAVMRRPGRVAAATAVVMVALSAPALRTEWTPIDATVVPTDQSARIVSDRLSEEYGGTGTTPVTVAVEADDPAQVAEYAAQAGAVTGVRAPAEPLELADGTWQLALPVDGTAAGSTAQDVVAGLRDLRVDGVDALVGGPAASFIDQQAAIGASLPLAVSLLVLLTLIVLWLMTGSVVLPLKAVVMNTLTVGVALGVLTFVYQGGRLTGLLGYTPNGGVEPTDFLVTAALVFALSTDYGVFLLGRIKEERDAGLTEREAVATGLGHTGAVVTAAALLLAVAIGAFSTSSISFIQQIGVATAVGVLVDAFVVRSLLVPSLMGLLGKWNWWAPMWLRRLHDRVGLSEGPVARIDEPARVLADTP